MVRVLKTLVLGDRSTLLFSLSFASFDHSLFGRLPSILLLWRCFFLASSASLLVHGKNDLKLLVESFTCGEKRRHQILSNLKISDNKWQMYALSYKDLSLTLSKR